MPPPSSSGPDGAPAGANAPAPGADLIAPLQAELEQARTRLAAAPGRSESAAAERPAVTIMGDRDIPYRLLRKVMSTCAQAQYTEVAFAVRTRLEPAKHGDASGARGAAWLWWQG